MHKTLLFVSICLIFHFTLLHAKDLSGNVGDSYHGDTWQNLTAAVKLQKLNQAVNVNTNSGKWPNYLQLAELFIQSMSVTFDTVADDMPTQGFFFKRSKLIHSVGAIAQGKFVSYNNHNYTGLFKGSNYNYIRFSSATEGTFTPGAGLKFLRSGFQSANFFIMYSLEGQTSKNYFRHDFSNHPPDLSNTINGTLLQLKKAFEKASPWPTMVGFSDFASVDENGKPERNPLFPFRLVFHPPANVRSIFPDTGTTDLVKQLKTLNPMLLYYVYAEAYPNATPIKIGHYEIITKPTSSYFSDVSLFMQHQRFDDDLAFRPEWRDAASQILSNQRSIPHYVYNDLPDSL